MVKSWQQQATEVVETFGRLVCSTVRSHKIGEVLRDFYFQGEPIAQPFRVVGIATRNDFVTQAVFLEKQKAEDVKTLLYFYFVETD